MPEKNIFNPLKLLLFLILLLIFIIGCSVDEPISTPTAVAKLQGTAVPSSTPTLKPTITLTAHASATHTISPTETSTPTAVPSQTPVPLPLASMTPFPTVTPDYLEYPTKPIFFSYGGYGGDGGTNTDEYYGRQTPSLIIYGDGQLLLREGIYKESITFLETTLAPAEMCTLRDQIKSTGFLNAHNEFFTEREQSAGAGELGIQVENTVYLFYGPNVQYLVQDLAEGVESMTTTRGGGLIRCT